MHCTVEGCSKSKYAAGLCSVHYNRKRTTGTVEPGKKSRASIEERFWRQVDKKSENECWNWTGKALITGYGKIGLGGRYGKSLLAHRYSWMLHNGPIPEDKTQHHGMIIMHKCDNRLCVNPNHLQLGTQKDNVHDMWNKGRSVNKQLKGEAHHNSKFTADQVRQIRTSSLSNAELGRQYGVPRATIRYIRVNGWKSVDREQAEIK